MYLLGDFRLVLITHLLYAIMTIVLITHLPYAVMTRLDAAFDEETGLGASLAAGLGGLGSLSVSALMAHDVASHTVPHGFEARTYQ